MNLKRTLTSLLLGVVGLSGIVNKSQGEGYVSKETGNLLHELQISTSLQERIDQSSDGDTIFIKPGTYNEALSLPNHSVKIIGESWTNTILDGIDVNADRAGIYQEYSNNVEIRGLTIRNFETQAGGMWLSHNGGNVEVSMTTVENNSGGIFLGGQSGGHYNIHDNLINNNHSKDSRFRGIYFWFGDGQIVNNTIINNAEGGIGTYYGPSPLIGENVIKGNGGPGIFVDTFGSPLIINNLISENSTGIYSNMSSLIFNNNLIVKNKQEGIYAWDWVGVRGNVKGLDNIILDNGTFDANNIGVTTIDLRKNWWGVSPPDVSKIKGSIVYEEWLNSSPGDYLAPKWDGVEGIESIQQVDKDSVVVAWSSATDNESDVIYDVFKRSNEETYDRETPYWSGTSTSLTDNIFSNERHWYNVRARNIYGNSDVNINELVFPKFPTLPHFLDCFNGPGQYNVRGCGDINYDADKDIDLRDFSGFQTIFTSP